MSSRIFAQVNFSCSVITLPPEIQDPPTLTQLQALNFYLSLYEQDPDWVAFIQQELNNNTPLGDIPGRLTHFISSEKASTLRRDLITEFSLHYARSGALLPVEPSILEHAVRSYLDSKPVENLSTLQESYKDLQENGRGSLFFYEVVSYNHDFIAEKSAKTASYEALQRLRWEGIALSKERLERAEYNHALLLFEMEDRRRGIR